MVGGAQTAMTADTGTAKPQYRVTVYQRVVLVVGMVLITLTWLSTNLTVALFALDLLAVTIGVGAFLAARRVDTRYKGASRIVLGLTPILLGGTHIKVAIIQGIPADPIWQVMIFFGLALISAPMLFFGTGMVRSSNGRKSTTLVVHHLADLFIVVISTFASLVVLQYVPLVQGGQSVWTALLLVTCNVGLVTLGAGVSLGRSSIPSAHWGLVVSVVMGVAADIWIAQMSKNPWEGIWAITALQALVCLPLLVTFTMGNPYQAYKPRFDLEPTNTTRAGAIGAWVVAFLSLPFIVNLGIPVPLWGILVSVVMSMLAIRMWTLIGERDNNLTQRYVYQQNLRHKIQHDLLTDLWSRSTMADRFLAYKVSIARPTVLVYVRILGLQEVRQTLGHDYGDEAIRLLGALLRDATGDLADVFRFRREEFMIIFKPPFTLSRAQQILDRILEEVDQAAYHDGHRLNVHIHMGMVPIEANRDLEDAIRWCEVAADEVKDSESMIIRVHHKHIEQVAEITLTDQRLREALRNDMFYLVMLPIMDAVNHTCLGFEALARWRGYDTSPLTFVHSLEQVGLADVFGRWVLEEATRFAAQVKCPVSVNVSIPHIQNSSFVNDIRRVLEEVQLPPDQLTIEFSERELSINSERVVASLSQVRDLGVQIALDDLGTGGLTLAQVSRLPIEIIKIDPTVISKATRYEDSRQLLQTITEASFNLGLALSAEGIETNEALNMVIDSGCTMAQGFMWSKPLTEEEAAVWWTHLGANTQGAR